VSAESYEETTCCKRTFTVLRAWVMILMSGNINIKMTMINIYLTNGNSGLTVGKKMGTD